METRTLVILCTAGIGLALTMTPFWFLGYFMFSISVLSQVIDVVNIFKKK